MQPVSTKRKAAKAAAASRRVDHKVSEDAMLEAQRATATVAVKDLDVAKNFYEKTLGLRLVHDQGGEALTFATAR